MTALSSQMQQKMNEHFTVARIDTLITKTKAIIVNAAQEIERRPSLKGCNALAETSRHPVVIANKDESSATLMSIAAPIPGLSEFQEAIVNVTEDRISNRKSVHSRPQDLKRYTPKQEREIREEIAKYLAMFRQADEKLQELEAFKSCNIESVYIDSKNDRLIPVDEMEMPKYTMKMDKTELHQELERVTGFRRSANIPNAPKALSA